MTWQQVDEETLNRVLKSTPTDFKPIVEFIHNQRVCTVTKLLENFPTLNNSTADALVAIGSINQKIYAKVGCALYPKEVAATVQDSAYSLGVLTGER